MNGSGKPGSGLRGRCGASSRWVNVIRKEAWLFCRSSSGVRLCWELEEPSGEKGADEFDVWLGILILMGISHNGNGTCQSRSKRLWLALVRLPRKALRGGISKVNFQETWSIFGDKRPQNGSKNDPIVP